MSLTIAFDLDGTLLHSVPQIADAVNTALAERRMEPLSLPIVQGFVGRGLPALVRQVLSETGLPETEFDDLHARILTHYVTVDTPPEALYPGVRAALGVLRDQGHTLTICTNKPHAATLKCLEDTGLALFFDLVIGGDSLPTRKPDPAMLNAALEGADHALYVGDSETDAETAEAAGIPFLLFTEGYRKSALEDLPHAASFRSFTELPALVAARS